MVVARTLVARLEAQLGARTDWRDLELSFEVGSAMAPPVIAKVSAQAKP